MSSDAEHCGSQQAHVLPESSRYSRSCTTGSRHAAYHPTCIDDGSTSDAGSASGMFKSSMHHIMAMGEYKGWSNEELRWQDYQVWCSPVCCAVLTRLLIATADGAV